MNSVKQTNASRVLFIFCIRLLISVGSYAKNVNPEFLVNITDDYKKSQPPYTTFSNNTLNPVIVRMDMEILRDPIIDEINQEITLDVIIGFYWEEPRLIATPDIQIHVSEELTKKLWLPEITFRPLQSLEIIYGTGRSQDLQLYADEDNGNYLVYRMSCRLNLICEMDFDLYPMDIQTCKWIISTNNFQKYMRLEWYDDYSLKMKNSSWGTTDLELPSFKCRFKTGNLVERYEWEYSNLELSVALYRDLFTHILMTYFPSGLLVIVSCCSFIINPDKVPGRIALITTTLLTLVTMFNSLRQKLKSSFHLKPIELWLIACISFVVGALLEYAFILLGMRYSCRCKRQKIKNLQITPSTLVLLRTNMLKPREGSKRKRIGFIHRVFKCCGAMFKMIFFKQEFLDILSLFVFPLTFVVFNYHYWSHFTNQRNIRWEKILKEFGRKEEDVGFYEENESDEN